MPPTIPTILTPIQPSNGGTAHIQSGSIAAELQGPNTDNPYTVYIYSQDPRVASFNFPNEIDFKQLGSVATEMNGDTDYTARVSVGTSLQNPGPNWLWFMFQGRSGGSVVGSFNASYQIAGGTRGLLPRHLHVRLDTKVVAGTTAVSDQLNGPILLMHSDDPNFASSWFSRPIDFGDEVNPAYWVLQKSEGGTWILSLRRLSGELAIYHFKATAAKGKNRTPFPMKLRHKVHMGKDLKNWPRTITVSPA